jgi:hypothetical protein
MYTGASRRRRTTKFAGPSPPVILCVRSARPGARRDKRLTLHREQRSRRGSPRCSTRCVSAFHVATLTLIPPPSEVVVTVSLATPPGCVELQRARWISRLITRRSTRGCDPRSRSDHNVRPSQRCIVNDEIRSYYGPICTGGGLCGHYGSGKVVRGKGPYGAATACGCSTIWIHHDAAGGAVQIDGFVHAWL